MSHTGDVSPWIFNVSIINSTACHRSFIVVSCYELNYDQLSSMSSLLGSLWLEHWHHHSLSPCHTSDTSDLRHWRLLSSDWSTGHSLQSSPIIHCSDLTPLISHSSGPGSGHTSCQPQWVEWGGGAWEDTDQYSAAVSHSHQPPSCNHL